MSTHKVFVYGTLLWGEGNSYLLKGSTPLGRAVSAGSNYRMPHCGLANYPMLVSGPGREGCHHRVRGEVWEVGEPTLTRLDQLEGHPHMYCRERRTFMLDSGGPVTAWVYIFQRRVFLSDWVEPVGGVMDWANREHANAAKYYLGN